MYLRNYAVRKTWLDKCLEKPLSEDLSKSNMLNGIKDCCNLGDCIFTIFIDHSEHNSVAKSLF